MRENRYFRFHCTVYRRRRRKTENLSLRGQPTASPWTEGHRSLLKKRSRCGPKHATRIRFPYPGHLWPWPTSFLQLAQRVVRTRRCQNSGMTDDPGHSVSVSVKGKPFPSLSSRLRDECRARHFTYYIAVSVPDTSTYVMNRFYSTRNE